VERRWAEIASVPAPVSVDTATGSGRRYRRSPLGLWTSRRRWAFTAGGLAILTIATVCAMIGLPVAAVPLVAAGIAWGAARRPDARAVVSRAWQRAAQVRKAYGVALREWEREARAVRFHAARERLVHIRNEMLDQRRRYDADLAAVQRNRLRREWGTFLESRIIADWHVRQVDARTRSLLRSYGIVNAADVTRENLRRVPGLSRHAVLCLMVWRANVELEFRRRASAVGSDERAIHAIKLRHLRERTSNWARLAGQAAELRRLAHDIEARRPALRERARELADALAQAEADANISPLFYKTWT
jgi:DNA-binding helix-hairpin-helix protein with protein kinase domain